MFPVGVLLSLAGMVSGQSYPNKPIRIVTVEPGGSTDFAARLIARGLTDSLGQQVIVDNRGGANGIVAMVAAAKATPDGYTLLVNSGGTWILPLMQDVPYHPLKSFSPITLAARSPNILVVHPSVAAGSVRELIALLKAKPGHFTYAVGLSGASNHLAGELFRSMAGVNMVRVNYRGAGPALIGLMAGEAQLMFPSAGSVAPHLKSGRLRALAVTGAEPSALLPGLPTVAASGLPGYESVSMSAVFAPAGTPATLIDRLNQELVRVLNRPDVKERFANSGAEVVGSSREQLTATMQSEMVRLGKVIKDAGIRTE
jgi:tripartite-type tricarboxylate transporter receptor subunit TctC